MAHAFVTVNFKLNSDPLITQIPHNANPACHPATLAKTPQPLAFHAQAPTSSTSQPTLVCPTVTPALSTGSIPSHTLDKRSVTLVSLNAEYVPITVSMVVYSANPRMSWKMESVGRGVSILRVTCLMVSVSRVILLVRLVQVGEPIIVYNASHCIT